MTQVLPPPAPPETDAPWPPPDPTWVAAERALDVLAETTGARFRDGYAAWAEGAEREVLAPLRAAAERAATAHQALAETAAFHEEAPLPLRQRALTYAASVRAGVLAPLLHALADGAPAARLEARTLGFLDATAALADEVPRSVVLPEAPDLYEPDKRDRPLRALRKATVYRRRGAQQAVRRAGNALRRTVGRPPRPLSAWHRVAPARALFAYHLHARLPEPIPDAHAALQQAVADAVAALEAAANAWTRGLLGTLERLAGPKAAPGEQPGTHATPSLRWPAADGGAPRPAAESDRQALVEAAEALQAALDAAAHFSVATPEPDDARLAAATAALRRDLRHGGTFFLKPTQRQLPPHRPADAVRATAAPWARWHLEATNRLVLCDHLVRLATEGAVLHDALLHRTARLVVQPVLTTFGALLEQLRTMQERLAAADPDALAATVRTLRQEAAAGFERAFADLPGSVTASHELARPGRAEDAHRARLLEALPEVLHVHVPAPTADPDAADHVIPLGGLAAEAAQPPLAERLEPSGVRLRRAVLDDWGAAEEVEHVALYNLEVALSVLEGADDEEGNAEDARAVAHDGLARAADRLLALADALRPAWDDFAQSASAAWNEWRALYRRAGDSRVEREWLGAQHRLRQQAQRVGRGAAARWARAAERGRVVARWAGRRTRRLIAEGQTAVGVAAATETDRRRTLDALAEVGAVRQRLPLVYRKLFTFEPLATPALLEGRSDDVAAVAEHVRRWRQGQPTSALILPLPPGAGRTSLLQALRPAALADDDVRAITLDDRVLDEAAWAARLADALGLPAEAFADAPSLEAIEDALCAGPPRVCLIDDLEHLHLRAPGGTALLARTLVLFSRTDTVVCWIAAASAQAWHYVARTDASASALVTALAPAPLTRDALEALVIGRHRRSGLPLRFVAPDRPPAFLRGRLRRARTEEDRQAVLRQEFFDRLYRAAGQNLMLALYYWLRSADVETEPGVLLVRPLVPLGFDFLDAAHSFTLGAFLQHGTLTVGEHGRIFRLTEAQSTSTLEALFNLRLIEPAKAEAGPPSVRVQPGLRYRLNPLVIHPITERLQAAHLLY